MGNRLSKIATRTGDEGTTGLGDGSRVDKDSLRVQAGYQMITEAQVISLDALLEKYNAELPALQEFILPGGSRAAALGHVCRTVCRRAERVVVSLGKTDTIHPFPRQYLNRLSDLLFVLSRVLNRFAGGQDVLWKHDKTPAPD